MQTPETLVALLEQRAESSRGSYRFVRSIDQPFLELSYSELARWARSIAARLQQRAAAGQRVLLIFPAGPDFLAGFFACLYAGMIAVPTPPPVGSRLKSTLARFRAIAEDARPTAILSTRELREQLASPLLEVLPGVTWLATDQLENPAESAWKNPDVRARSLAYLQYTSGSTGNPRGVMLNHANVLHNLGHLRSGFGYGPDSVCVTWMPHFHDFGLVDGLLQPLFNDIPVHVLSPLSFLKRPLNWLLAIDRVKATHSHAPNFAFELCLERITRVQSEPLDLSTWRVAANGAEPVRAQTLRRFAKAFAHCGFSPSTFYPGYGLAEATLFVTVRAHLAKPDTCALRAGALEQHRVEICDPSADESDRRELVCCGRSQDDTDLRIVDPQSRRASGRDEIGEVWVASASVAQGYWGKPEDSRETFQARIEDDPEAGPFLRTGDLGFVRAGELYITGRLKDLIIIAGVNYYPQDLEWTVEDQCAGVRPGRCVAFSIDCGDEERLVIVAEPERGKTGLSELAGEIRSVVAEHHGVAAADVVLVKRGGVSKTSSGKLQRKACRQAFLRGELPTLPIAPSDKAPPSPELPTRSREFEIGRWLCARLAIRLGVESDRVDVDAPFSRLGLDSRSSVALIGELEERFAIEELSPTLLWRYPSVRALSKHLSQDRDSAQAPAASRRERTPSVSEPVAIVGMACRFPRAQSPAQFWDLLLRGETAIGASPRLPGVQAGFLDDPESFDADFFGLSASEANAMDPQQRLLLEVAWEALENSCISPRQAGAVRTGVFIGISAADYAFQQFSREDSEELISAHSGTGIALSIAANRLSYQLDLSGPSMAIDTACSSSLVAVHQACQSLRQRECELAIAGGVSLIGSSHIQLALERAGMLSPRNRCATFDASADGYVRGEGCGIVALKLLKEVHPQRDNVLAVVRGSAINQDGRSNGLTAPNPSAQEAVIREAASRAGLEPREIGYVETHGTGTRLGDPIEVSALQSALGAGRDASDRCWLGSVKTNIGHLEAAAGIAGLIKTVLCLRHGELPPHPHLVEVNPLMKLEGTPFAVARDRQEWAAKDSRLERPRIAAVSSFGFGGTNAHVLLQQASQRVESEPVTEVAERPLHLFTLSAQDAPTLRTLASRYADWFRERSHTSLPDLCHSTTTGRAHLPERWAARVSTRSELAAALSGLAQGSDVASAWSGQARAQTPSVVFLFSGQGSQYVDMSRQLFETLPEFRQTLQECDELLCKEMDRSLLDVLFSGEAGILDQTIHTQPALFSLELALARVWQSWGVNPAAVLGHSVGEYVAACLAGVFSLSDGLKLIAARARLMQGLPSDGGMLVTNAEGGHLQELLEPYSETVSVAAFNAPRNTVVSGRRSALEQLRRQLEAAGMLARPLKVSHAFHSPSMEPILDAFRQIAERIDYASPRDMTLISNLDGNPIERAPDAEYWVRHLRETVRFSQGIQWLGQRHHLFVEVGPRPVLSALGAQCVDDPRAQWLPSLHPDQGDWAVMLESLARLHLAGVPVDWDGFDRHYPRRRLGDLPNYPFRRRRCSLLPSSTGIDDAGEAHAVRGSRWCYQPSWEPVPATVRGPAAEWLLLSGRDEIGDALSSRLTLEGERSTVLRHSIPTDLPAGEETLGIVCLWGLDLPFAAALDPLELPDILEVLSQRLLDLLQFLAGQSRRSLRLSLVTRNAVGAEGEPGSLEGALQSLIWGLARSLRQEQPEWRIRLIDIDGTGAEGATQLFEELVAQDSLGEVRRRGSERLALRLRPVAMEAAAASIEGAWMITGGLGRIGMLLADWLADTGASHLLLVGRSPASPETDTRLAALRDRGVAVATVQADVGDAASMQQLPASIPQDWPDLTGVIHAAGVLDDGILRSQTAERFGRVLSPKVVGGWNLHLLTQGLPIRHFVLFSSAASVLGNAGQSTYAAANAFLDALAGFRRGRGLPATSLNWSAWAHSATDPRVARQLASQGVAPIVPEQGLSWLQRLLASKTPQQVAIIPSVGGDISHPLLTGWGPSMLRKQPANPVVEGLLPLAADERKKALQQRILEAAASILGRSTSDLSPQRGFFDQGLDSLNSLELRNRLQRELAQPLPSTLAFDYPTPAALADHLSQRFGPPAAASDKSEGRPGQMPVRSQDVAIVSIACRFPGGADRPEEFWKLLRDGVDAITEVPANRWSAQSFYHPDWRKAGSIQSRYGGFVSEVEMFDAVFFGISPREAVHLDPQQRLLLEVCWELLERAGTAPSSLQGSQTGVFIGISTNDYLHRLARFPERIDAYLGTGNALSLAANRLSFTFGLEGPSVAVDTACSSSLVAIHQACQSLRSGETDMAISGGVNLLLDPTVSINHSRARMLSADGRCKAFSAQADGFVRSEGCGLTLLKRLSDAQRDGDSVLAVIRGSAANQDGSTSGLTVPNGPAQQKVIRRALRQSGLEPAEISYVEAHGTGTSLGDPIEAGALGGVFGSARQQLTVGSVKTNIGHLESAAGVAGLIKTVLSLEHRTIPPSLHCETKNPRIDWTSSPIRIPGACETWISEGDRPLRAGVSSFGFGGTNAHVVVEEPPQTPERTKPHLAEYLLLLSAKTEAALRELARNYVEYLEGTSEETADICYTAACGRDHFSWRLAVVGESKSELRHSISDWIESGFEAGSNVVLTPSAQADSPQPNGSSKWRGLASRYARGENPDWPASYAGSDLRRVVAPGHPFERQRYWIDPPSAPGPSLQTYQLRWIVEATQPQAPDRLQDHWLILADRKGWGEELAADLRRRGARCTLLSGASVDGFLSDNDCAPMTPEDAESLPALPSELSELKGIVHLWGLDLRSPETGVEGLVTAQRRAIESLVNLVQQLDELDEPPRLWTLTQAALGVEASDRVEGLSQSPLWGLGRSLALELPRIWGGILDLPAGPPNESAAAMISAAIHAPSSESHRALRGQKLYVPRLFPRDLGGFGEVTIREDASYLITGGLGSLGREFGRWLAQRGARHLWLLGRRGGDDPQARSYLEELERLGVQPRVASLDVADAAALQAQLADWGKTDPPLRGVIHAAGVNEQRPIIDLQWPHIESLLGPKVQGGWALHEISSPRPLEFFLNCSSVASIWGGQKQAAYSAANAFLDSLSAYRNARGLAGLSINYGPLAGTAMLSQAASRELESYGLHPRPVSEIGAGLLPMLSDASPQLAVLAADWNRFASLYQSRCPTGLFSMLTDAERPVEDPAIRALSLEEGDPVNGEPPADLNAWLTAQLCDLLRLPPQRLDSATPLQRLGLDSLMAMELRNRLRQQLGRDVPLAEILSELSLKHLVMRLETKPESSTVLVPAESARPDWVEGEI